MLLLICVYFVYMWEVVIDQTNLFIFMAKRALGPGSAPLQCIVLILRNFTGVTSRSYKARPVAIVPVSTSEIITFERSLRVTMAFLLNMNRARCTKILHVISSLGPPAVPTAL